MGRPLSADEAKAAGIVNTVVSSAELEAEAMKAAREISNLPPEGVGSRRLMRGTREEIIEYRQEAEQFNTRLRSPEARAAFVAFLERKRAK